MKYKLDQRRIKIIRKNKPKPMVRRRFAKFLKILANIFTFLALIITLLIIYPPNLYENLEKTIISVFEKFDFKLAHLKISGNSKISEKEIRDAIGVKEGADLLSIPIHELRSKLLKLPWVKDVHILRFFPESLQIKISEEKAEAVFVEGNKKYLISEKGKILEQVDNDEILEKFIRVKGKNSNFEFKELLDTLHKFPKIRTRLFMVEKISDRRWNLILNSKALIKLPESQIINAIDALEQLNEENKLISLPTVVDLRLAPDRIYIKL
jgi:cell division protein FtsQ